MWGGVALERPRRARKGPHAEPVYFLLLFCWLHAAPGFTETVLAAAATVGGCPGGGGSGGGDASGLLPRAPPPLAVPPPVAHPRILRQRLRPALAVGMLASRRAAQTDRPTRGGPTISGWQPHTPSAPPPLPPGACAVSRLSHKELQMKGHMYTKHQQQMCQSHPHGIPHGHLPPRSLPGHPPLGGEVGDGLRAVVGPHRGTWARAGGACEFCPCA